MPPVQKYVIEQLLGMNRNAAEGAAEQNPVSLRNLIPTRQGGWQIRGFARFLNDGISYPTYPAGSSFNATLGYDHQGFASYREDRGIDRRLRIIVPPAMLLHETAALNPIDVDDAVHLPGVGAYEHGQHISLDSGATKSSFAIQDRDGAVRVAKTTHHLVGVTLSTTAGAMPAGRYRALVITYFSTKAGKLVTGVTQYYFANSTSATNAITATLEAGAPTTMGAEVYLARNPINGDFSAASGAVFRPLEFVRQGDLSPARATLTLTEVQFGPPINISAFGHPYVVRLTDSGTIRPTGVHSQRMFFIPSKESDVYHHHWIDTAGVRNSNQNHDISSVTGAYTDLTVGWSEQGYLNLYNPLKNYLTLPAANSTQVTAFAGTQEGLIIFCENESFMMRGDPSYAEPGSGRSFEDFNTLPYMPIGCDASVIPGRLGPEVYTIWKGEVYQITNGQATNVSEAVYDRTDKFVQVVGDVEQNAVLCRSVAGRVFAFYPAYSHWTELYANTAMLLPTPTQVYAIKRRDLAVPEPGLRFLGRAENEPARVANLNEDLPTFKYSVSMGDKHRRKMLKRIRLPLSRAFNPRFRLIVSVDGTRIGRISDGDDHVGVINGDSVIFAMPLGVTGYTFDLEFQVFDMKAGSVIEGPIELEYVDRGQKR